MTTDVSLPNQTTAASQLMVFLFSDLVDSVAWKKSLGDAAYEADLLRPHNRLFRDLLTRFPGSVERNFTGDGFLATFASPSNAVNFALWFQWSLGTRVWSDAIMRTGQQPQSRVGIHLGEAIEYSDGTANKTQVMGTSTDLCARLMNLGVGGQTLLSRHARDSAWQYVRRHPQGDDLELRWCAHGHYRFKGIDDALEVFEVGAVGLAPLKPPPNNDKAERVEKDVVIEKPRSPSPPPPEVGILSNVFDVVGRCDLLALPANGPWHVPRTNHREVRPLQLVNSGKAPLRLVVKCHGRGLSASPATVDIQRESKASLMVAFEPNSNDFLKLEFQWNAGDNPQVKFVTVFRPA